MPSRETTQEDACVSIERTVYVSTRLVRKILADTKDSFRREMERSIRRHSIEEASAALAKEEGAKLFVEALEQAAQHVWSRESGDAISMQALDDLRAAAHRAQHLPPPSPVVRKRVKVHQLKGRS